MLTVNEKYNKLYDFRIWTIEGNEESTFTLKSSLKVWTSLTFKHSQNGKNSIMKFLPKQTEVREEYAELKYLQLID